MNSVVSNTSIRKFLLSLVVAFALIGAAVGIGIPDASAEPTKCPTAEQCESAPAFDPTDENGTAPDFEPGIDDSTPQVIVRAWLKADSGDNHLTQPGQSNDPCQNNVIMRAWLFAPPATCATS